jgi:monoamine oxidase
MKRRGFIRTVIAGGAGMAMTGLPNERVYAQPPANGSFIRTNRRHIVREPAHMIRDGHQFQLPAPAEFKDVVIVGAGANSLVAAYSLPGIEVVCLEKEPRCGGNAQCQATAHRMEEIFPGSINHLVEIRLPLRAHSWVTMNPGYLSELKPVISRDVGRVIVSATDHNSFDGAYAAGLENATRAREWVG